MEILPILHAPPLYRSREPAAKRQKTLLDPTDDHATRSNAVFRNLLKEKKLSLVLDLDNTLLHSARFENLSPEEQGLILNGKTHDAKVFRTVVSDSGVALVTKLRPGLAHFLEKASKLFLLHVFTKGSFLYALKMLELIDPGRVYFESVSRIFGEESCTHPNKQKSLDLVVGEPRGILIVDDRESVWEVRDRGNLVVIPEYHFFGYSKCGGGKSQLVMGTDESESEGHLSSVLAVLEQIHEMFFDTKTELQGSLDDDFGDKDVGKLLMDLYQEYLLDEADETEEEIRIIL